MKAIHECLDDMEAWAKLHHDEPRPSEPIPPLNTRVGVGTALAMRYLEVIAQLDQALWCLHAIERVDFRKRGHWKKRAHDLTHRENAKCPEGKTVACLARSMHIGYIAHIQCNAMQ